MKITILGCGTSAGVPNIAFGWEDCDPNQKKNRRLRSSILVEIQNERILIDTTPDLREQLLTLENKNITAVFFTHAHADHSHGIDDLRPIVQKKGKAIHAYFCEETFIDLQKKFSYIFETPSNFPKQAYPPLLKPIIIPYSEFNLKEYGITEKSGVNKTNGVSKTSGVQQNLGGVQQKIDQQEADVLYEKSGVNKTNGLINTSGVPQKIDQREADVLYEKSGVNKTNGGVSKTSGVKQNLGGVQQKIDQHKTQFFAFKQDHGFCNSTGFRINNFAYSTDVLELDEVAKSNLQNLDLWIVDSLQFKEHLSHSNFNKTLNWIRELKPKKAILTHLSTKMDYDKVLSMCPENVEPAFDGMVVEV